MQTSSDLGSISFHEGKGPEKEKYEDKIRRLHLKRVAFRTMWLSAEDYPRLLGRVFYRLFFILFSLPVSYSMSTCLLHLQDRQTWGFVCTLPHQG